VASTCGYGEGLSGSINAGNFLTSCKVHWLASQEPTISAGERPVMSVVCCQIEVSATSLSLVQRSPIDCAASLCMI
jgi:hypothetical protein